MADPRVDKIVAILGGEATLDQWFGQGNNLLLGYAQLQAQVGAMQQQLASAYDTAMGLNSLMMSWRSALGAAGLIVP